MGNEMTLKEGSIVYHKEYGEGIVTEITGGEIYTRFGEKQRIFPHPYSFDRGYLTTLEETNHNREVILDLHLCFSITRTVFYALLKVVQHPIFRFGSITPGIL